MNKLKRFYLLKVYIPFMRSLKIKMILINAVCIILSILIIAITAYTFVFNLVKNEIIDSNTQRISWVGDIIDEEIDKSNENMLGVFHTEFLNKLVLINSNDSGIRYEARNYVTSTLYSFMYPHRFKDIVILHLDIDDTAIIITSTDKIIINNSGLADVLKNKTKIIDLNTIDIISNTLNSLYGKKMITNDTFFIKQKYESRLDNIYDATLILGYNWDIFRRQLSMLKNDYDGDEDNVFFMNNTGDICYRYNESNREISGLINPILDRTINNNKKIDHIEYEDNYIFFNRIRDNLIVVKVVSNNYIIKWIKSRVGVIYIIAGLVMLAGIILITYFSKTMTKPLVNLSKEMRYVIRNNFNTTIAASRKDEIGVLQKAFVYMIKTIKQHIEKEYHNEIQLKNAQLKALSGQIKAHFFRNTLQMIGGMSIMGKNEEVYKCVQKVGSFYNYCIKFDKSLVSLREEMNNIKNYLYIQQMRYSDMLELQLLLDKDCMDYMIPKMVVYSIVENIFIHAFNKENLHSINILIKTFKEKEFYYVVVSDNGRGIEYDLLQNIRKQLSCTELNLRVDQEQNNIGIGLVNSNIRLKLHFGSQSCINIFSEINKGTKVIIKCLAEKGDEDDKSSNY